MFLEYVLYHSLQHPLIVCVTTSLFWCKGNTFSWKNLSSGVSGLMYLVSRVSRIFPMKKAIVTVISTKLFVSVLNCVLHVSSETKLTTYRCASMDRFNYIWVGLGFFSHSFTDNYFQIVNLRWGMTCKLAKYIIMAQLSRTTPFKHKHVCKSVLYMHGTW